MDGRESVMPTAAFNCIQEHFVMAVEGLWSGETSASIINYHRLDEIAKNHSVPFVLQNHGPRIVLQ